ncbi:hypothetical protein [Dysgonomonas sp. ZJ709]|uniref:hypothetical protein n=1 Tax=Dysgonomonas sp. ZJ709 TaxID=2709797 RepID=UPI0013E9CA98|nr:hypothetical protein [Dysgonomonas sp. ZJ709]
MKYSVEDIYKHSGQFDKVVNVETKYGSESRKLFSNFITGSFVYTPIERKSLQGKIDDGSPDRTDGYVRFDEILNQLSDDKKELLKRQGILASDIEEILQLKKVDENQFIKAEVRELPKPLEIRINGDDFEDGRITLGLYSSMLESGYALCPFEKDENYALLLTYCKNPVLKENIYNAVADKETGELPMGLKYKLLKNKFLAEGLTEAEQADFTKILESIAIERGSQLKKELEKSTEKYKEIGINYADEITRIMALTSVFEPERLTHNKLPVWWDYERFIHIYIRHVSDLQVGERFEAKTVFQYKFKDIKTVVKNVLASIEEEIQKHFELNPEKSFKRQGEMSIYYQGDYYAVDIAPGGRLMAFYKRV